MMSTSSCTVPEAQSRKRSGVSLSVTFWIAISERFALPAVDSAPDEPAPITLAWLTPKLKERMSIASFLLTLGPGRPLMMRYALTAIFFLLKKLKPQGARH